MKRDRITNLLEGLIFGNRPLLLGFFLIMTILMGISLSQLRIDAGFAKLLPLEHEYMQTYIEHGQEFGGANRVMIALMAKEGDIFTADFFETLEQATDDVFFIPGVDRSQVSSLFTPNVRYTEVVEDGIAGGNVVPADFTPTAEGLERVRENILKAGIVGRLVANDFSGAMISAELLEIDPGSGERLDFIHASALLEEKIRETYQSDRIDVHIIGFAKVVGDIADGAQRVVLFFLIAFIITTVLVFLYTRSVILTLIPLACSLTAVIWQLGMLPVLGYGIDPMGLLVPFLIFAIGVSHAVQMITANTAEVRAGAQRIDAAKASFRQLLLPGFVALASDTIGFITIRLIEIQVIQEMAVTASLGVAAIILTNLVLLPILLSYVRTGNRYHRRVNQQVQVLKPVWRFFEQAAEPRPARIIIGVALVLFAFGAWKGADVKIGDMHRGVPELRTDSRYNMDSDVITTHFSIGVDLLSVIVETEADGCIDYDIMSAVDRFAWHMNNVPGVQSVVGLPGIAKTIYSGWNEGSLKWRVLPRNQSSMVQAVGYVPTSSRLLNSDCSVMPIMIFTEDHKAETIDRIVAEVKSYRNQHPYENISFRLATGNVGVMAATNEEVSAAQFPILLYVFGAVILLCYIQFRSIRAVLCIVLPLGLVSLLAYALMSLLEIGLKVSTLPVVALGVGVGVDYGIYIFSRLRSNLSKGMPLQQAYLHTLAVTGNGVVFTGATLAIGVATWIFSPLKFQADMGILLTFMFLVNMLGAILLLPALACLLLPKNKPEQPQP
ncbi:efflux RND transporter permease subunit [Pelovirga terrestris]|uniref:MMPL family transporter n=1 Tax=Pelovirga terrestris TaxID=2771352 RepID=A0A8J6QWM0_9BACT|nr:MMPL family transporter [Pelovirga terrestris]MBD1400026.1 MMPL family transporter [Pelovirga terrestris]